MNIRKKFIYFFIFFFLQNLIFAKEKYETIRDVENYINNISYLSAQFFQDDKNASQLSEGHFYLHKPYKLVIDYKIPFKATIYVDQKTVLYYDKELNEVSSIRTADTPLKFFLRKKNDLRNKNFNIVDVFEDKEEIKISFSEKKNKDNILYLTFKKQPIQLLLIKISTKDQQNIEMTLLDTSTKPIDNSIFNYDKKLIKKKNK